MSMVGQCRPDCGACCDPVTLGAPATVMLERVDLGLTRFDPGDEAWLRQLVLIDAVPTPQGTAWRHRCQRFDPETRTCTAYEDRPRVCRDYPWYGQEPGARPRKLPACCGYLTSDLFASADGRPLLPLSPTAMGSP